MVPEVPAPGVLHAVDFDLDDTTYRYPEGGPRVCRADLPPRAEPIPESSRARLSFCPVCVAVLYAACDTIELFGEELTDVEWRTVTGQWLRCEPHELPASLAEIYWDDLDEMDGPVGASGWADATAAETGRTGDRTAQTVAHIRSGPAHAFASATLLRYGGERIYLSAPEEWPATALEHPAGVRACTATLVAPPPDGEAPARPAEYCPVCVSVVLAWLHARASSSYAIHWCTEDGIRCVEPSQISDLVADRARSARKAEQQRDDKRRAAARQMRQRGAELLAEEWRSRRDS